MRRFVKQQLTTKEARIYQICLFFIRYKHLCFLSPTTKVQSPLNWEVPGAHLLVWALWQKYFWAEYILWRLSNIRRRQESQLNEMSRNVFNNNRLNCCCSLSTGNALWVILVANDWAQVEQRWTGGNHWMEYFSCSPSMKYFSRVILGNQRETAVIFALCPSHRTQQIFDLPRCSDSKPQHMRQFKQFFVTLLLKIFLSAGYFFITLEFCVRVTLW